MSVFHTNTSAANDIGNPVIHHDVHPVIHRDVNSDFQHSGIRATHGKRTEIHETADTLPCQHCIDEINERNKRNSRVRLCYYCHTPGHQIYNCIEKDNDETSQLLKQAINVGIRRKEEDVHCNDEMIVSGTDGGQWAGIWYVNPTFNHHFSGNISAFKRVKHMMGVETRSGMNNFLFIRGVGSVVLKTGNETLNIQSVYYSPEIDRNVLSLDQLTLQGFTVKRSGDKCKIYPMFSTPVINSINDKTGLTKEEELGEYEKRRLQEMGSVDEQFKEEYLNSYFETLNVSDENEYDWNLLILRALKFNEFADCKALIDMLDDREYVFKYQVDLQKKFEEMIRWFMEVYMGITSRPIPPYSPNRKKIDLLSLFILVIRDGGYREITAENTWPIIAKDLGFDYKDGDYIRIIYAMYLDILEYYYKFKSLQESVQTKEMVTDETEFNGGHHRRTKSAEAAAAHSHEDGTQYALFTRKGSEDDWNIHKKRKRFNFDHAKKAVDDANRSVMQNNYNITKV
ncbi:putative transcription factor interactor and regulator CCHC(Zn) family [Helianthus annuus]|nr:putative transcription factor interactor and regulator CCHC(Zn) family [Helianthus annuus]